MAHRDLPQFELRFRELFKPLCGFAMKYLHDSEEARGLVQDVFVTVWERMESLPEDIHYRSYLFTAVRNRCLNAIRDKKRMVVLEQVTENRLPTEVQPGTDAEELERQIAWAINSLPDRCREVFELSRQEGLKYAQIADRLGISVKTVEAQMSKALNLLRGHLKEFLTVLLFLIGY